MRKGGEIEKAPERSVSIKSLEDLCEQLAETARAYRDEFHRTCNPGYAAKADGYDEIRVIIAERFDLEKGRDGRIKII